MYFNSAVLNLLKGFHKTALFSSLCCLLIMQLMITLAPNVEAYTGTWPYDVGISYLRDNNKTYSYSFTITNISDEPQPAPEYLILPLESFNVINPDGYTASGNPYCDLKSVKGNILGPGMSLPPDIEKFPNPLPPQDMLKPPYVKTKIPVVPEDGGEKPDNKLPAGDIPKVLALANPTFAHLGENVYFDFMYETPRNGKFLAMRGGIEWDFGDGSQPSDAHAQNPTHQYTQPGLYYVTVKVLFTSDPGAPRIADGSIVVIVYNNPPVAIASADPTSGKPPLDVHFDGSKSYVPDASASLDPILNSLKYEWDFGDGSKSSEISPTHTYNIINKYGVKLTVTDFWGLQDTAFVEIVVDTPPVAIASVYPPTSDSPYFEVSFYGSASYDPDASDSITYKWDFGDGSALLNTVSDPIHIYNAIGTYYATLTVTDSLGLQDTSEKIKVIVGQNPVAIASANPSSGSPPLGVHFDGSASSDPDVGDSITSYEWNFGDGSVASGVEPIHTYTNSGTYDVTLTVTDSYGLQGTAEIKIVVEGHNTEVSIGIVGGGAGAQFKLTVGDTYIGTYSGSTEQLVPQGSDITVEVEPDDGCMVSHWEVYVGNNPMAIQGEGQLTQSFHVGTEDLHIDIFLKLLPLVSIVLDGPSGVFYYTIAGQPRVGPKTDCVLLVSQGSDITVEVEPDDMFMVSHWEVQVGNNPMPIQGEGQLTQSFHVGTEDLHIYIAMEYFPY